MLLFGIFVLILMFMCMPELMIIYGVPLLIVLAYILIKGTRDYKRQTGRSPWE